MTETNRKDYKKEPTSELDIEKGACLPWVRYIRK